MTAESLPFFVEGYSPVPVRGDCGWAAACLCGPTGRGAATFVGAWVIQRLVAAVQVSNARCVLLALSRVGAGVAALSRVCFIMPHLPGSLAYVGYSDRR